MSRKAVSPMSQSTVSTTNDEFYANHPEMIDADGNRMSISSMSTAPEDVAMRKEWMDSYEANGGEVKANSAAKDEPPQDEPPQDEPPQDEPPQANDNNASSDTQSSEEQGSEEQQPAQDDEPQTQAEEERAQEADDAEQQADDDFNDSPAGGSVAPCANAEESSLPPSQQETAAAADNTDEEIVCEIKKLEVQDAAGRKADNGWLMVVPEKVGDKITVTATTEGGCGDHPKIVVGGFWDTEKNASSTTFTASAWYPKPSGWLALKYMDPHEYKISSPSCKGNVPAVTLDVYPSEKVTYKLDLAKIKERFDFWFRAIPIAQADATKWQKKCFQGAIETTAQWKEDKGSYKAYCEQHITGGFDPLIGAEKKLALWPMAGVPETVLQYIRAGVFLTFTGGLKLQLDAEIKCWGDTLEDEVEKFSGIIGGAFEIELSLEAFLLSEDVISGKISGKTGVSIEGAISYKDAAIWGNYKVGWNGLVGIISLSAAWGFISYNRSYTLMQERTDSLDEDKKFFDL